MGLGTKKGFFGFMVVLAVLALMLLLFSAENSFDERLRSAGALMADAENASKERAVMENNVDRIVYAKLSEQMEKENFDVEIATGEVNRALAQYLHPRAFESGTGIRVSESFLNKNSIAMVIREKGVVYAEYSFTSSGLRQKKVHATLGSEMKTGFLIPIGYTVRAAGFSQ